METKTQIKEKTKKIFQLAQNAGIIFQQGYSFEDYLLLSQATLNKIEHQFTEIILRQQSRYITDKYRIGRAAIEAVSLLGAMEKNKSKELCICNFREINELLKLAEEKYLYLSIPGNYEYPSPCILPARQYSKNLI